jgi:hypothetical protein
MSDYPRVTARGRARSLSSWIVARAASMATSRLRSSARAHGCIVDDLIHGFSGSGRHPRSCRIAVRVSVMPLSWLVQTGACDVSRDPLIYDETLGPVSDVATDVV